jgi:hypothetical protein
MNDVMGISRAENIVRYIEHTDCSNNKKGKAHPTIGHEGPERE